MVALKLSSPAPTLELDKEITKKVFDNLRVCSITRLHLFRNTTNAAGAQVVPGAVPKGITHDRQIYLFAGAMGNDLAAFKVVFH